MVRISLSRQKVSSVLEGWMEGVILHIWFAVCIVHCVVHCALGSV